MTSEEEFNQKYDLHKTIQIAIESAHINPSPQTIAMLEKLTLKMEENYSKRELDEHFKDLIDRFDRQEKRFDGVDDSLGSLNTKVAIANGRTTKNEVNQKAIWMTVGSVTFLFSIIAALIVYSFKISQENLKNSILLEVSQINN